MHSRLARIFAFTLLLFAISLLLLTSYRRPFIKSSTIIKSRLTNALSHVLPKSKEPLPTFNSDFYLTLANPGKCRTCNCRMGNKMFIYGAIYGMARYLNRQPAIDAVTAGKCTINEHRILMDIFPNMEVMFPLRNLTGTSKTVNHGWHFCQYSNMSGLKRHSNISILHMNRHFWQNFNYFRNHKKEMAQLYAVNDKYNQVAKNLAKQYSSEAGEKLKNALCVHVRRDDYITVNRRRGNWYQASSENFTISAIRHILRNHTEDISNWMVIIMSDDPTWSRGLFPAKIGRNFSESDHFLLENDKNVFAPDKNDTTPSTDMAFFHNFCQLVLLTAPQSTFGFWAGYLSKAEKVYYNANAHSHGARQKVGCAYWPKEFVPLKEKDLGL